MPFLVLCFALAFIFQFSALSVTTKRVLRVLPFALMELFPLSIVLYYAIVRPNAFLSSWEGNVFFDLWIAGAILLGCGCAALVYLWRKP